jgi:hypothetical protein
MVLQTMQSNTHHQALLSVASLARLALCCLLGMVAFIFYMQTFKTLTRDVYIGRWFSAIACGWCAVSMLVKRPHLKRALVWIVVTVILVALLQYTPPLYNTEGNASTELHRTLIVIAIMLAAVVALVVYWLVRQTWFRWQYLCTTITLTAMALTLLLLYSRSIWTLGLQPIDASSHTTQTQAHLQPSWPKCTIQVAVAPRLLLPHRSLNFFTGFETCPARSKHFTAEIVSSNAKRQALIVTRTLHVQCNGNAEYQFTPAFFPHNRHCDSASASDLLDDAHYQAVLSEYRTLTNVSPKLSTNACRTSYTQPVVLPEHVQWVRVFCNNEERFLVSVSPNKVLAKRTTTAAHATPTSSTAQDTTTTKTTPPPPPPPSGNTAPMAPNSLILMVDAVSRTEFLRSLPKTSKWLAQQLPHDSANSGSTRARVFEFFRYMSLGGSTKPNLTPLLTGQSYREYQFKLTDSQSRLAAQLAQSANKRTGSADDTIYANDELGMFWQWFRRNPPGATQYITSYILGQCADYFQQFWGFMSEERPNRLHLLGLDHEIVLPFCHPDYTQHGMHLQQQHEQQPINTHTHTDRD